MGYSSAGFIPFIVEANAECQCWLFCHCAASQCTAAELFTNCGSGDGGCEGGGGCEGANTALTRGADGGARGGETEALMLLTKHRERHQHTPNSERHDSGHKTAMSAFTPMDGLPLAYGADLFRPA